MKPIKYLFVLICLLVLNFEAIGQHALNLEACYSDVRQEMSAGGGRIFVVGDSLSYGPYYTALKNLVQTEYGNGGNGWQGFSRWSGAGVNPGFTEGAINQDVGPPFRSLNGLWLHHDNTTNTSAYIVSNNTTTELVYLTGPDYGSFLLVPSVGSAININANGTEDNIAVQAFNSTVTGQNWVYSSGGQKCTLLGLNNRSGSPGPILDKVSNGGWGVNNFLQRDSSFDQISQYLSPDLYIIMLGQNDNGMGQSVYETKLTQLHSRLISNNPQAKILFVSSYNSGASAGLAHSLAMRTVATTTGSGYIDLYTVGGTHQDFVDNGYLDPDGIHFNNAGGFYVASLVFNALESYGASLRVCDTLDFNQDALFPDSTDIDDFLNAFSGGFCPISPCDLDFNNDGLTPDSLDIDSLLSVFSGGPCL